MTIVPFNIIISNDIIWENNENFSLTIRRGSLPNRVNHGSTFRSAVTIFDVSSKLTLKKRSFMLINLIDVSISFNQSTYNVIEDGGSAQPVLVLSNPSSTDITLQVRSNNITATGE